MKFLRNKDVVSGTFLAALSVWAFLSSGAFAWSSISAYGNPAVVPRIVAGIIFILAVFICWDGVKNASAKDGDIVREERGGLWGKEQLPELFTFLLLCVYVLALKQIGFVIATAVYLCLQMFVLSCFDIRKLWLFLITAVIISPALFYVFRTFFDVLLPAGILGWNP